MTNPRESAYGAFGGMDSGPHCMPVVSATGMTPLLPLPPSCASFRFQDVGRFTWKLILGADGSTGAMLPTTLQYSGIARTARSPFTACGDAPTNAADVTVAPVVGSPMEAGAIASPASESQLGLFRAAACGANALPVTVKATMSKRDATTSVRFIRSSLAARICKGTPGSGPARNSAGLPAERPAGNRGRAPTRSSAE